MNGVRSTFMRRGYLLTALAALLLLAASAGTASAQSVSFSATTGVVPEGVVADTAQAQRFRVTITRSPVPAAPASDNLGTISVVQTTSPANGAGFEVTPGPNSGSLTGITFNINNQATLFITQAEDDDWLSESVTLALQSNNAGTSIGAPLVAKSDDNEVQPTAKFSRTSVSLTENSRTTVGVTVGVGQGETPPATALGTLSGDENNIQVKVTPANAFAEKGGVATLRIGDATTDAENVTNMPGVYAVGAISDAADGTAINLHVMANDDMSGFQNPQLTLEFVGSTLKKTTTGNILAGPPAVINIQSDEPVPTLSFSPTDVTINEGESVETVLIAEGAHGSEVGMVKLMVEGDADVSLMQGDKMLEEMDDHVYVNLGTSNSARLTAMSHESRELADGDMAYKAWKLVEGSTDGAMIGEGSWFKVDVVGSTAVPALPLIGQLLLALFLMAGGSRLYRRRQD